MSSNRHNFDITIDNQKSFDVVSNNQTYYDSTLSNRHYFDIIFSGSFINGENWTANFVQNTSMEIDLILSKTIFGEIISSFSSIINPILIQYINIETLLNSSMEIVFDSDLTINNLELYLINNIEGILLQNLKINNIETMLENNNIESSFELRHYFLLNNYSGSLLSELDSMLLQDMDYELL